MGEVVEFLTNSEARELVRRRRKFRFADDSLLLLASKVQPLVFVEGEEAKEKELEVQAPDKIFLNQYVDRMLAEMREAEKKRIRFGVVQRRVLEHFLESFSKLDPKSSSELKQKLLELGFVPVHVAVSIANNLPMTPVEVRVHFGKDGLSLTDEQVKRILDLVAMYA